MYTSGVCEVFSTRIGSFSHKHLFILLEMLHRLTHKLPLKYDVPT